MNKKEFSEFVKKYNFNVYKLNYTQEFKDKLPIKWDIWANRDLSNIPEIYHVLFTTDWNWGPYSKMDAIDRGYCNDLFLEYHHKDLKQKINEVTL